MNWKRRCLAPVAGLFFLTSGCAALQSTEEVVRDWNRVLALSRNEVLLLNILRASAREPLQFSTMGTISGNVGNSGSLTIPFTNIIVGGEESISPSLTIQDAVNPNVQVVPLSTQAFVNGLLTPIAPDKVKLFLHSGWDAEFLLPLLVGAVICPDGTLYLNRGEYADAAGETALTNAFRSFFATSAKEFAITESSAEPGKDEIYYLTDNEAVSALRQGIGSDRVVAKVEPAGGGKQKLTVRPKPTSVVHGFDIPKFCADLPPPAGRDRVANRAGAVAAGENSHVIFRSVEAIIYYLGESHRTRFHENTADSRGLTYFNRDGEPQTLFKIECGATPQRPAVQTEFHDVLFWIPAIDLRQGEGTDRTLKTLSFLDQLIALQTSRGCNHRDSAAARRRPTIDLPPLTPRSPML